MNQVNSLDFLQNKNEALNIRIQKATELYDNQQLSLDTLIKWLSRNFSNDQSFRSSAAAWKLLKRILQSGNFKTDKFTIYMKPTDLLPAYKSDFHKDAFDVIQILVTDYPNAWRPDYFNLMEFISEMLKNEIRKEEISLVMRILLSKPEVVASNKEFFDKSKKLLLTPILQNINQLDKDLSFKLLASFICVPYFVQKAADDKGKTTREIVDALNAFPQSSSLFAPYLIQSFVRQMNLLNIPLSLSFPLELIENSKNLDIAAPLIKKCRELKMYTVKKENKDLDRLQNLANRCVKERRSDVLVELTLIDFNTVQPILKLILSSKEITTPELCVSILKQIFELKNPMILFEIGDLPSHILSIPDFINEYCKGVSYLIPRQLLIILDHLVGYTNRIEESCLLYWTIKSGPLTDELSENIDKLLNDCFSNPWRFVAAVIAAKKLQKKLPPPLDIVKDPTTHPIILDCFLYENYGMIEFQDDQPFQKVLNTFDQVPLIPSPYMSVEESLIYRNGFVIKNLPNVADSISSQKLIEILSFVISNAIFASSLESPMTIADYCLSLLHNSSFYESESIRNAFAVAALPLLPSHHLSAIQPQSIQIETLYRCAIVCSLPLEFLYQKVSTAAFVGIFTSFEGRDTMEVDQNSKKKFNLSQVFADFNESDTFVKCIVNISENVSKTFVRHNFERIFAGCTNDSAIEMIPILLEKLLLPEDGQFDGQSVTFPSLTINRPSQLISLCNFFSEHKLRLPFEETLFPDDLSSFCAQLRAGQKSTITILLEQTELRPEVSLQIVSSLISMNEDGGVTFSSDFLKRLINSLVQNSEDSIDKRSITTFCGKLTNELIQYFLDNCPLFYYPAVFTSLNMKKEDFQYIEKYVLRFLRGDDRKIKRQLDLNDIKLMCSIRLSRNYTVKVVNNLFYVITSEANMINIGIDNKSKIHFLRDVCLLIQSVTQMINNCNRVMSKEVTSTIEIVRKMSSLFHRAINNESPSYKQLKTVSKMFAAVAKVAYNEELHYLIASFVSHLTLYQPDGADGEQKMRSLQTAIFPLFTKCSREQMNEISASLHESHREIFRQITERWTKEAQYKGKV